MTVLACGILTLWVPLVIPLFLGGEDSTASADKQAARDAAAATSGAWFPRRFEWGFETTDERGRELYAMEEVPLSLGDRPTQPDWVQDFGARADPARRDRFPREPAAALTSRDAARGRRSLHLESRGDCARVRLARPVAASGGLTIRLGAVVKLRGLQEGNLRLQVSCLGGDDAPPVTVLESPPLSGDHDWNRVEIAGQVPEGTEFVQVSILLEGSYRDGESHAWVDSLELVLAPGLRFEFAGRKILLFGASDPEIPFDFEARGVPPGPYEVEVKIDRLGADASPRAGAKPLVFRANRYAIDPTDSSSGSARRTPVLRFQGDLRRLFPGEPLPDGPLRLGLRLRRSTGPAGEDAPPIGEEEARLGILPGAQGGAAPRGLRLGMVFTPSELRQGGLEFLSALPEGFPIAELLWDMAGGRKPGEDPPLPPEIRLAGQRVPLAWRGRFGPDFPREARAAASLREWSHRIRSWEAALGPENGEAAVAVQKIRSSADLSSFVTLGSPAAAVRPAWSSFQVFELGETFAGPEAGASTSRAPEVQDWTIAPAPREADEREEFLHLSRLLLDIARAGHHRVFFRGAVDLLAGRPAAGARSPRLAAFAWVGLGRILSTGPVREDYPWDSRGTFLAVSVPGGHVLITMARGREGFERKLWTGVELRGEDLLGNRVAAPFDEGTGESVIPVGLEPVIWRGFDPCALATVESLVESGPGLKLESGDQEVQFRVKNRGEKPVTMRLALKLPDGLRPGAPPAPREVEPGAETTFRFPVGVPDGFSGSRLRAGLRLDIDGPDRKCAYSGERRLAIRSDSLRIAAEEYDAARRRLTFTVESAAGRPLAVHLWCRVFLSGSEDLQESWEERLPPQAKRSLAMDLDLPPATLAEKEVLIGAEVRGGGESLSGRYHLRSDGGRLRLIAD
jgi:hypothetical protein